MTRYRTHYRRRHDRPAPAPDRRSVLVEAERRARAGVRNLALLYAAMPPSASYVVRRRLGQQLAAAMDTWREFMAEVYAYDCRYAFIDS